MAAEPDPRREAVALRYDQSREHAPRVVAKGRGSVAERLLALAREHQVPLWEDRDLVKLLGVLELDAEVPPAMYAALAEVLARIYRLNAAP
ncbi:MAG: EscU/YscU/HrcU family type III secretion system export apparatus switch protein [Planctomycetota bacterium]